MKQKGNNIQIFTVDGYFLRFYELLELHGAKSTHRTIYLNLERELYESHNVTMYQTYDSFRMAKHRWLANRIKENRKTPVNE